MDYKKKYKEEVVRATQLWECGDITRENLEYIFPELKESEDDRKSNGGIVFEDFNEGDGFYKVNLAYLSKEQVEEIENIVKKWNPEPEESEDEKIRKYLIILLQHFCNGYRVPGLDFPVSYKDMLAWLEKQSTPQVRTGLEWVNTIDDACDKRYAEEYAHGEYCHEQSFKWGFQEGVDWLEKQGESTDINPSEFDLRLNKLLKQFETLSKEELASSLSFYLNVVQNDGTYKAEEKQGEQKPAKNIVEIWKDMRLEVYQQASGNRHEPNYSDDTTKMFSLNDIDEIIEKMSEQKPADWSEEDEDIRDTIIRDLKRLGGDIVNVKPAYKEEVDWLKSLKQRIGE